jgi:transposase-like protein
VSGFRGRHFEVEIVLWAVVWYCRFGVSYRDLEQMMGERGVLVDHSTIYRRVQRYAPEIEKGSAGSGARRARRVGGSMRRKLRSGASGRISIAPSTNTGTPSTSTSR